MKTVVIIIVAVLIYLVLCILIGKHLRGPEPPPSPPPSQPDSCDFKRGS